MENVIEITYRFSLSNKDIISASCKGEQEKDHGKISGIIYRCVQITR